MIALPSLCPALPWEVLQALPPHVRQTYQLIVALAAGQPDACTPPVSRAELGAACGLSTRSIDAHLRILREAGYVRTVPGRAGLPLILAPQHLPDGAGRPLPEQAAQRPAPSPQAAPQLVGVPTEANTQEQLLLTIKLLSEAGVYPSVARRLAREPWITPELVAAWVAHLQRSSHVQHLGGVLTALLRRPETCLPPPLPPDPPAPLPPWPEDDVGDEGQGPAGDAPTDPLAEPWARMLAGLRTHMGAQQADVWLRDARALSCNDGVLVIGVRSSYAADWLGSRYEVLVRELAADAWGQALTVRFRVR